MRINCRYSNLSLSWYPSGHTFIINIIGMFSDALPWEKVHSGSPSSTNTVPCLSLWEPYYVYQSVKQTLQNFPIILLLLSPSFVSLFSLFLLKFYFHIHVEYLVIKCYSHPPSTKPILECICPSFLSYNIELYPMKLYPQNVFGWHFKGIFVLKIYFIWSLEQSAFCLVFTFFALTS